jgi:hypothetical protein
MALVAGVGVIGGCFTQVELVEMVWVVVRGDDVPAVLFEMMGELCAERAGAYHTTIMLCHYYLVTQYVITRYASKILLNQQ